MTINWLDKLKVKFQNELLIICLKCKLAMTLASINLSSIIRQTSNTIIQLNYFRYRFWFQI